MTTCRTPASIAKRDLLGRHHRGADLTRRSLLIGAASAVVVHPAVAKPQPARKVPFGAAIQAEYLDDAGYRALFRDHCEIVLPMNELKFDLVQPERGSFDFEPADRLVDFALSGGKRSRGHTVVWWNGVPPWLAALRDPGEIETELRRHVDAVVGRYAGRLESWDVCNEVVAHEAPYDAPLRDSFWQRALGSRHIPIAFQAVAAADPKAKLVLNDYDLEFRGERHDRRRASILEIARQLQDAGIRIDAVGLQGHLYADQTVDIEALARFGEDLRRMGIALMATELDVIDWKIAGGPSSQDAAAARSVGDFLEGIFAAGPPLAVISWGMTDRHSWVDDAMPHGDGTPSRPLPFDANGRPKHWFALIEKRLREG